LLFLEFLQPVLHVFVIMLRVRVLRGEVGGALEGF
jgi:hypothetical protein